MKPDYRARIIGDTFSEFKGKITGSVDAILLKLRDEFDVQYLVYHSSDDIESVSWQIELVLHDILTNMGVTQNDVGEVTGFRFNIDYRMFDSFVDFKTARKGDVVGIFTRNKIIGLGGLSTTTVSLYRYILGSPEVRDFYTRRLKGLKKSYRNYLLESRKFAFILETGLTVSVDVHGRQWVGGSLLLDNVRRMRAKSIRCHEIKNEAEDDVTVFQNETTGKMLGFLIREEGKMMTIEC